MTVGRHAAEPAAGQPASSGAGSSDGHLRLPEVRVRPGGQQGGEALPPPPAGSPAARPRLLDWSRFDVQISLQNLRSLDPSVVTRELRKLHLRWFHAKEPKMRVILSKIGLESVRLNLIKGVCDTCRDCRAWDKPGHI
eukprot:314793-Pyramimonas_sp.AAC.1